MESDEEEPGERNLLVNAEEEGCRRAEEGIRREG